MRAVARGRNRAVPSGADRYEPGGVIADVAVHICVDDVLTGSGECGEGVGEFLPIPGAIDLREDKPKTLLRVVDSPLQSKAPRFSGDDGRNDRTVFRDFYVKRDGFCLCDLDDFMARSNSGLIRVVDELMGRRR